jgi:predicted nucleic acid-binding protein
VIPVDAEIAAKGAEIRVEHRLSLGDAIIIASALVHDTELLTFDKKMQSLFERLK